MCIEESRGHIAVTYRSETIAQMCICGISADLLQYNMSCILVRHHVAENDIIKIGSDWKKYGLSPKLISSHWSWKLCSSQRAYTKVHVTETAFLL